jgi:hypothetical protein
MTEQNQEKKEPIVIDNTSNVLGWLEKILKLIKDYGITKIFTGAIVIAFLSLFFWFIFNPTRAFEVYDDWETKRHLRLMELRMENAPKIQSLIDKLTFKINASRSVILEMHNGNTNNGGIPFTKCSATYESLNVGINPISGYYQDQNLSLIPFATFLFNKGYWCGHVDELMTIDRGLCYKLKSNGTEHIAACVIDGIDKPLAFMIVSFGVPEEDHDCTIVRENLRHVAMKLSVYFEVEKRSKNFITNN